MREIEFRAWNVATKKMIDLKKMTPLALNMDTDGLFIPFSDGLILMQYTGLKDKHDKKIFEGDKLKIVIKKDDENHPEYLIAKEDYVEELIVKWDYEILNWISRHSNYAEIIGNIYD